MKSLGFNLLFWGIILLLGSAWVGFGIGNRSWITAGMGGLGLVSALVAAVVLLKTRRKSDP